MKNDKKISKELDEYELLIEILSSGQANDLSEIEQIAFKKQFHNAFEKLKNKIKNIQQSNE